MKTKIYYLFATMLLSAAFASCSDSDGGQTVYFPQGEKAIGGVFAITDEPYIVKFVATITGADYETTGNVAGKDVTIKFEVDMSLVGKYNEDCKANYLPMPEGTYSIPASAIIEKGKGSTDSLSISIAAKDKFESFVPYLLPIRITEADGANTHKYQQVIYLTLSGVADMESIKIYDRSKWEIVDFSTEEPGEGGGNGLAKCIIDDDKGTYWHTKWAGGEPEPPHDITIDMGAVQVIHGIALMNRYFEGDWAENGHGQPKNIKVSISKDGETWIENGSFYNLPHPAGQPFRDKKQITYNNILFSTRIYSSILEESH